MAAKKTSKKQSKSDFIRSQPTLSAADIVAKAKAEGFKLSSALVYMVRGRATPKKTAPKKTAPTKTGAKKTLKAAASKQPTRSKADFVRARSHLSPKEIVEDAKAEGLKLDPAYVHNVRGYDRTAAKQARRRTAAPKSTASSGIRTADANVENLLKAAAAELGLGRSIEILQAERARVRAVIAG